MVFPKNNLPTQSQPWTRDVEKRVENLESTFRSAEVNNVTRDSQTLSQVRRLDQAVTDVTQAAADAAAAAASAQSAIDQIVDLGSPGGPTINANNITAGTLTGITVQTGNSGTRSKLSGSNIEFFSSLYSGGSSRVGYIQGDDGGNAGLYIISDQGEIALDSSSITLAGDVTVSNSLSVNGDFSPGSINTGSISGSSLNITGDSTLQGRILGSIGTFNATAAFAANMFIASNGNIARATGTSSREAKQDIAPLEFDKDAFLSISPVTFKYKDGIITEGENPQTVGFIAEDFVDAGLSEHLVTPANEFDSYIGLRYEKMYMFLHKIVQDQAATIKVLQDRITALEGGV